MGRNAEKAINPLAASHASIQRHWNRFLDFAHR